jgi:hypothetical protein
VEYRGFRSSESNAADIELVDAALPSACATPDFSTLTAMRYPSRLLVLRNRAYRQESEAHKKKQNAALSLTYISGFEES